MKLSPGILTWDWKNRIPPPPRLAAERRIPINSESKLIEDAAGIDIKFHPENSYAFIKAGDEISACKATGSGGFIEVVCDTDKAGTLTVQENMWSGWYAWRDGEKTEIIEGDRIQVSAPAGKHKFTFRYLPWDVPLGLLLFTMGVITSVRLWLIPEKREGIQNRKANILMNGETKDERNVNFAT